MTTFRRRVRLFPLLAATVIATGLATPPAWAGSGVAPAQTGSGPWMVSPGGPIMGHLYGLASLTDPQTGSSIVCLVSTLAGSLASGSGLPGTGIGSITSLEFSGCTGPGEQSFTVQTTASGSDPVHLNAISYASGVTTGTLTNFAATLSGPNCIAIVAGPTATTPGTMTAKYHNGKDGLGTTGGGNLHFWDVSGCLDPFHNGNHAKLRVCYVITPPQTITSSQADLTPDTTGGTPC